LRTNNGLIASKLGILTLFLVSVSMIDGNGNGKDDKIETMFENQIWEYDMCIYGIWFE